MKKISNAVILAGGDGDRFWPMKHKCAVSFLGISFLEHLIAQLSVYTEHLYVVGSQANRGEIEPLIRGKADLVIQEDGATGMAGAVLACRGKVRGEALVIGNDYIDFKILEKLIEKTSISNSALIFLARKMHSAYFPGGYLELKDGRAVGIIEKPDPDKVPSDLINIVIDYFRDIEDFMTILERTFSGQDDRYERGMNEYLHAGKADYIEYDGYWQALKYPWHVLQMDAIMRGFLKGQEIDQSAYISDNAVIEGDVTIGKDCKIGNFVKIAGPCYIGQGTIIGDYSLVRESSIGQNALIGSGCEVARSYVGDNASLHRNYIGDSLVGNGVLFGAGAVTANFRFDQKHVQSTVGGKKVDTGSSKLGALIGERSKVGVNTTLFPGVKIGQGSIIAPGGVISQDIPDNTFVINGVVKPNKL